MNAFLLDASALVKRFATEKGSPLVNHLFASVTRDRLSCVMLGAAELVATLVRKRNGGLLSSTSCALAVIQVRVEVLDTADFTKLAARNSLVKRAINLLLKHAINSSDSLALQTALDLAVLYRDYGDDLVLVASDQRLLKAAQAEGLVTFDPETQSQTDLDKLIGP